MAVTKPNIIDIRGRNRSQWQGTNNSHKYIAIHYLGVKNADNPDLYGGGYGGHFNITRDGKIYQAADYNAVLWQVGTAGYYTQKHPEANNYNCVGIECSACYDSDWYMTKETEQSLVKLVKWLMQDLGVDETHVLRHYDVVNKNCPIWYVENKKHNGNMTWTEFKKAIKGEESLDVTLHELKKGDKGPEVLLLQEILRARGFIGADHEPLKLDRVFGDNTKNALKRYEKSRGFEKTGVCTLKLWHDLLGM